MSVIDELGALIEEHYILTEKIPALLEHLHTQPDEHDASAIVSRLRQVDKHFSISTEPLDDSWWDETMRQANYGFKEVRCRPNNTAYINLSLFPTAEPARDTIQRVFQAVADTKMMIMDLRHNGGGADIHEILGYFIGEQTYMTLQYRHQPDEVWRSIEPPFRLTQPLTILIGKGTVSAAEAFAYTLGHMGRATLIGEPTLGAAHTVDAFTLCNGWHVFIPNGRPISPFTGSNWEGCGVRSDLAAPYSE